MSGKGKIPYADLELDFRMFAGDHFNTTRHMEDWINGFN
jgi:hypothetical protein